MRRMSELMVPGFGNPVWLCQARMPQARGMAAYGRMGPQPEFIVWLLRNAGV